MAEYATVVALIAIAAIVMITYFSRNLRSLEAASANELAGREQTSGKSAGAEAGSHAVRKGMSNFGSTMPSD